MDLTLTQSKNKEKELEDKPNWVIIMAVLTFCICGISDSTFNFSLKNYWWKIILRVDYDIFYFEIIANYSKGDWSCHTYESIMFHLFMCYI